MKYYIKKKIALILAASIAASQTSFIFASENDLQKETETMNQNSDNTTNNKKADSEEKADNSNSDNKDNTDNDSNSDSKDNTDNDSNSDSKDNTNNDSNSDNKDNTDNDSNSDSKDNTDNDSNSDSKDNTDNNSNSDNKDNTDNDSNSDNKDNTNNDSNTDNKDNTDNDNTSSDNKEEDSKKERSTNEELNALADESAFDTNLDLGQLPESYKFVDEGLRATANGDQFFITDTVAEDFVYSADITFNNVNPDSAAALVFRKKENVSENDYMYVANLSPNGNFRLFKFEPDTGSNIAHAGNIADLGIDTDKGEYTLKVVCVGKKISYYIDDILVTSTGDYFAPNYPNLYAGLGQRDILLKGNLGFLTWGAGDDGADITYQNVYYGEIEDGTMPQLTDLQISGNIAEYENNFKPTQYNYQQYVSNDTENITIKATPESGADVKITKTGEEEITGSTPLEVGQNFFTIEVNTDVVAKDENGDNVEDKNGDEIKLTAPIAYRLSVFRRYPEDSYYNEDYRGQYHYSVKDGWANDPNGLIQDNSGKYHMFYQFFPSGTKWGPMHWMHATSDDLITWEEKPVAFYPNEYGAMYSGCAVYDKENTSGLVSGGGYIVMITAHSEDSGQRMILAYSTDGDDWEYYEGDEDNDGVDNGTIVDWTDGKISSDNGHSRAFRDPKIFRYNNKWFMVIAGGILRIYSSENLIDWELESHYTFPDRANDTPEIAEKYAGFQVETECPDLYRLPTPDDYDGAKDFKWVLSYGGRYYRIGDFKQVNGHYQFVPDDDYKGAVERDHNLENVEIMNFGPDSYAAMTYYVDPSFTGTNKEDNPDVIAFNWMNTWDNYCNAVADVKNDNFNGTFNLNLKLSLAKDADGKLVLQQTPIEAYNDIIQSATTDNTFNGTVEENGENPFANFEGDSYLIEATFTPEVGTTDVGFHVRTGTNGEKTTINYNVADKKVTIDRSNSGKYPTAKFKEVAGQVINETENPDGSITLHIYVDRSSVEVFSKNYTVAGAMQIFPMPSSKGLEVYSKGGNSQANIEVKQINSIWTNKVDDPEPQSVQIDKTEAMLEVGQTLDLNAWLSLNPMIRSAAEQNDIVWSIDDNSFAELMPNENNANSVTVTAKTAGEAIVTATSKSNSKLSATCTIKIVENNVNTNLTWNPDNISWYPDNEVYIGKNSGNSFMFSTERSAKKDYTYELDVKKGFDKIVNIVFESQNADPWGGCYAVQLAGNKLRLFDFKNDFTFKEEFNIEKTDDDKYHVQIAVKDNTIKVTVNETSTLEHTITETDRQYSNGLFGVGLYETEVEFSNLFVTYNENNNSSNNNNKTNLKDIIAKISAENYVVNGNDANTQQEVENWIKQKINSLDLSGATVKSINIGDFTAASEEKEGSFTFTVTVSKGNETASSGQLSGTITKIGDSSEDLQKVIDVINSSHYTVSGKTANTKSKVESWLKDKIQDINITKFVIDTIDIKDLTKADNKTDGNFTFTVTISKGEEENKITLTSKQLSGIITKIGNSSSGGSSSGGKTGSSSSYRGSSNDKSEQNDNINNTNTTNNENPNTINQPNSITSNGENTVIDKFIDVKNHWAIDNIKFVVEKGYFAGTSENSFSPDVAMTRAMVVSVLGRVANAQGNAITKFVDVDQSQYYAPFIGWALQNGIASGVSETEFSPNTNVTREQLAVMFANFMKQQGYTLDVEKEVSFTDSAAISPWAIESVEFMVKAGILNGRTDGSFDPKGIATRAEVATVLKLFLEKTNK